MFILTVKSNRIKKIIIFIFLALLALFSVFTLKVIKANYNNQTSKNISVNKCSLGAKSNEDRINFLSHFGWKVNPEPLEILEITIPEIFNATYENYNFIQKNQGLDLSRYKGKSCTRFTYQVLNHKDAPKGARANILIYKNKVIGGDICSVELGGFMHGFSQNENITKEASNGETQTYNNAKDKDVLLNNNFEENQPLKTTFNENPVPDLNNPSIPVD